MKNVRVIPHQLPRSRGRQLSGSAPGARGSIGAGLFIALPFVASAAMLTVIQAPISFSALAWVSFVPFILVCSPQVKPRRLALVSYVISLCYWLGNLYWVAPVTIVGWVLFCLYTALLWPILAVCLRYCRMKKIPLFLAAGVLVVGVERMQGLFLGGFFWRFLAHSQYQNITLIQIADIFGAGGVSFLIAMVNGLVAELIIAAISCHSVEYKISNIKNQNCGVAALRQRLHQFCILIFAFCFHLIHTSLRITNFLKIAFVCAAVVAVVVYGRWRISQEDEFVKAGLLAASLQSNVPQSVKRTFESGEELFDGLMEQSKAAVTCGAELIVWPETMVQATLNPEVLNLLQPSHPWKVFDNALREHSKDAAFVLVGAYGGMPVINEDLEIHLAQRYNSAFLYNRNGDKTKEVYNKIHLVPFGEVLPLRKSLPGLYRLLMKVKFIPYNFDYSLDYGSEYTVFEMTGVQGQDSSPLPEDDERSGKSAGAVYKFGVMICYEDTVPAIARRFALDKHGKKRLDWLVNISNDGWFVRFKDEKVLPSTELPQHAAVCVFRAVENRLAILRSVNTGISCLIDSLGRIRNGFVAGTLPSQAIARTGMAGWFTDRIPIDNRTTFFSKYGEWLDFCCEISVILLIIVPISVKFFRTRKWVNRLTRRPNEK